nr:MAG TPA: hypothetical protein [Caudoviricetes sp.]
MSIISARRIESHKLLIYLLQLSASLCKLIQLLHNFLIDSIKIRVGSYVNIDLVTSGMILIPRSNLIS